MFREGVVEARVDQEVSEVGMVYPLRSGRITGSASMSKGALNKSLKPGKLNRFGLIVLEHCWRDQAIASFDRWSMSAMAMAMLRQHQESSILRSVLHP
jgi:hypothetical protein